ncbi:MAG: hypothetical protein AB1724_17410 [Thermodesulfobacteriota bacterium]
MSVQVKGTILVDLVKQVRVAKDKNWGQYLTPEDMALVNGEILTSAWYPDAFFYRLSLAVYKVIGGSSTEACFAYGQLTAHNMIEVYKNILVQGDPASTIERFVTRRQSFFSTEYQDAEKNHVEKGVNRITLYSLAEKKIRNTEVEVVIVYSLLGIIHELAVIAGGKNVGSHLEKKDDQYALTVQWK